MEVPHEGNTNASPEEAAVVAELVGGLLGRQWQDRHGAVTADRRDEILVVTPYNAQIRAIQELRWRSAGPDRVQVGTVDKFQGREAPVAIYSMATSSADEAPRGLEFLYDPHRLNVATSRARALALIVASPALIRVSCQTPRQMYLANALCRAWEEAPHSRRRRNRFRPGGLPGALVSWAHRLRRRTAVAQRGTSSGVGYPGPRACAGYRMRERADNP